MSISPQEKAPQIAAILAHLYPAPPIPLKHQDPYTLLIAVLLSAQCTDVRVNKVTPELFHRANTPDKMVQLSVDEIRDIIRPCGLAPRKSRAIHDLSRILLNKHSGNVPEDMEDLEALPGVGHKTASVVLAQAFDMPTFPVDTHIHRLAWRWGLSNGKSVKQTEKDLKLLFPEDAWIQLHLRFIYFGREYCPARGHDPLQCPICQKFGREELFQPL